jgi:uncharacterized protein
MGNNGSDRLSEGKSIKGYTRGNRPTDTSVSARKNVWLELTLFWLAVLLVIRLIVFLQQSFGLPDFLLGLVPLLFIYAPVWLCKYRQVDSWSYRLSVPAFRDWKGWWKAIKLAVVLNIVLWPWFVPIYHVYYSQVFKKGFIGSLPEELLLTIAYQIFYVAIPEEFFYRGYFQTRFNEVYERKWLIFGVPMGMATVYSNLFFAFGHSLVQFQWWHFATFFPGLMFSWARERSNGILPGAFFHATCNIGIICLDTMYGLRSPI